MSRFNTPTMDPAKIEPHDLRRDIETYRENYPTVWEWYSPAGRSEAYELQSTTLRATAAGNPYAAALATLVLNIYARTNGEPS